MRYVVPGAGAYAVAANEADFAPAFALALGWRFIAGLRVLDNAPELGPFAERNAGVMILFSLALAGAEDDTFPPTRPVPLSINALAHRFSVSRKHVLTLLNDAEQEGLLLRGGAANGEITLLPRGRDALENMLATMFLYLAQSADEALHAGAASPSAATATSFKPLPRAWPA